MSRIGHAALTIGVAEGDVTPPVGVANRCWGAASHDVASGVHRSLEVCVWVIQAEPVVVLVGLDGSWWQGGQREERCRTAIAMAAGTTPAQVLLCLSHSHAAVPLVDDVDRGPGSDSLARYLDDLPEQLAAVTRRAAMACTPGILQAVYGSCTLAACRDQRGPDSWAIGHDPDAPADQTLAVMRFVDVGGVVRGLLVNYACHPTSLAWQNSLLSPDFVGALRARMSESHGAPLLFVQGAGGDLAPAWQYSGDPEVADRNGECLALSVRSSLATLPPPGQVLSCHRVVSSGAELGCWQPTDIDPDDTCHVLHRRASLPWRESFESTAELDAAIAAGAGCELERLRRRQRLRRQFGDGRSLALDAWAARLGEILFFGAPAENYSQLQVSLRRRYPNNIVLVANHCNGGSGYLMPRALHRRRGFYPAWQSPLGVGSFEQLRTVFEELGGDLLSLASSKESTAQTA